MLIYIYIYIYIYMSLSETLFNANIYMNIYVCKYVFV